jgi:chemotaxis protein methyltransferase CheR
MMLIESTPTLTDGELQGIVRLVYEKSGITLHAGKRALIVARLNTRVRAGGFRSFGEYLKAVRSDRSGRELGLLLDAIATNHTSFYREPQHFTFLRDTVVPRWRASAGRPLQIWSAACSTGEEPYTIAMTLADCGATHGGRVHLLASDLSSKALARARAGVYPMDKVQPLPMDVRRRHFEKGVGTHAGTARVQSHVRQTVQFEQLNLLEIRDLGHRFDAIFCRNVMIYFDKAVQQRVVAMLERHLRPGGFLFISHSESLNGIAHGLHWVAPATYEWRRP